MLNRELLESQLAEYPLFAYGFVDPKTLDFTQRVRYICQTECPMYGKSWACPPGVGSVDHCRGKCLSYENCLLISTIVEVNDIADMADFYDDKELAKEIETDMFVGEGAHFESTRYFPYLKDCKTKAVYIHHYQPRKIPTVHELAELMAPIPVSLVADGDVIEI